ncbi:MAG: hypothetical protein HKN23_01185 [Verrucomicrobiales bacterium]|nr:hypothetical protein [Verrucomicrobiales bacterium]
MKKFVIFLLLIAFVIGGGYLLYDPHLKPFLGPIFEKVGVIGDDEDRLLAEKARQEREEKARQAQKAPVAKSTNQNTQPKTNQNAAKAQPKAEPPKSEIDKLVEAQYPMPIILPLMQIVDNWNSVPPRAYPSAVSLKEPVGFKISLPGGGEAESKIAAGSEVKVLSLSGTDLTIGSGAMRSAVHVDKTDFKERITKRYNDFVSSKTQQVLASRAKAKKKLEEAPEKVAALTANAGKWDDTGDPRFHPVKASIARGDLGTVTVEEATSFRWNGSERVGGELAGSYDTVSVHFEVSTIFGKFPTDYKCLLNGNRVVGWIDPLSEEKL